MHQRPRTALGARAGAAKATYQELSQNYSMPRVPEVPEVQRQEIETQSIIETDPFMNVDATNRREETFAQIVSDVHNQAVLTLPSEMALALCDAVSAKLLAYITAQSERTVQRWAKGDVAGMKQESERRLVTAYEILQLMDRFEEPGVAATWLIGNEPQLDSIIPATALREDRLEETLAAARHFVAVG